MHGFTFNDTNIKIDNKHVFMFIVFFYVCVIEGKTMHYFNDILLVTICQKPHSKFFMLTPE